VQRRFEAENPDKHKGDSKANKGGYERSSAHDDFSKSLYGMGGRRTLPNEGKRVGYIAPDSFDTVEEGQEHVSSQSTFTDFSMPVYRRRESHSDDRRRGGTAQELLDRYGTRRGSETPLYQDLQAIVDNAFQPAENKYADFHARLDGIQTSTPGASELISALKAADQPSAVIVSTSLAQRASFEQRGSPVGNLGGSVLYAHDWVGVTIVKPEPSGLRVSTGMQTLGLYGSEYHAINTAVADLHSRGDVADSKGQVSYW
jgi:hypothetical protein